MTYTPEQLAAIESQLPLTIVEAGAGSGKTATIAGRAAHLVRDRGVEPGYVLCLTFTRAATGEIRSRIDAELGRDSGVTVSTFHAFAASLCVPKGWRVATEIESEAAIESLYKGPTRLPTGSIVGKKQLERGIVEHEAGAPTQIYRVDAVGRCLHRLREGLLIPTWDLVPGALYEWQAPFDEPPAAHPHVLVDEYQDVTTGEWALALGACVGDLCGQLGGCLFAVGDPRQSIMQFRMGYGIGENPTHRLTKTWRFGPEIAGFANRIAARFGGEEIEGADGIVSDTGVAFDVARLIAKRREGESLLILARTNHECAQLERDLRGLATWAKRDPLDPMAADADRFEEIWGRGQAVISTVHSAKGREADTVIACMSMDGEGDEAKVDYVAATRARKRLLLARPPEVR